VSGVKRTFLQLTIVRGSVKSQGTNRPRPGQVFWRGHAQMFYIFRAQFRDVTLRFDTEMDRADAIRLLQALADAGMDTRAPRANVWIEKKALEIGLEGGQFVGALAYAGSEGWLADAPRRGWTSLTRAGAAIASRTAIR